MPTLALLTAPGGPIELAEFPLSDPAPETAALKLRMAGICGSDLHIFRGELPLPCPFAMGHEMVGEIAERGEGLTTDATGQPLAVGDRVVTPYFWFCGSCHACSRGRPRACQNLMAGEYRTHEQEPHFVAAHAEYYCTSARQPLYKVPERLDVAADFGATHCLDAGGLSAAELSERVHGLTDGIGADWVLEVVGVPAVIPDGIGFLNNGGTLLEVGNVGMGRTFELDPSVLVYGNKSVRGVMFYDPVTLAIGLSFLQHNSFPFRRLLPRPFRLADINAAYAAADTGSMPRGALVP
ncbi:alcohol dehydrogenase catalytic domain-containing protein [Mycobacterium sp. HUMS_1102779]|uniref:alcohol dehydrogenase catalytic domain-containing protein n=1 Tax=Mycobacterium sp. HUMS_1102779 TaxID=3383487 RepID=UPI003899A627